MVRSAFILSLVAALLACLSRCSVTAEAVANAKTTCSHCTSDTPACGLPATGSGEESPVPAGEESCPSCLCNGAISCDHMQDLEPAAVVTYESLHDDDNIAVATGDQLARSAFEHIGQFARVQSGRKICAQICTYLN